MPQREETNSVHSLHAKCVLFPNEWEECTAGVSDFICGFVMCSIYQCEHGTWNTCSLVHFISPMKAYFAMHQVGMFVYITYFVKEMLMYKVLIENSGLERICKSPFLNLQETLTCIRLIHVLSLFIGNIQ